MKKISILLALVLAGVALAAMPAQAAGPPTPIGIAEAKRFAKKYIHDFCNERNCRGARIKNCESKTDFRVDCEGLYGKGAKDLCTFKISVQAVKDRQVRFNIFGVKCEDN